MFKHIQLSGTPAQIGYQHGSLLADRVQQCWRFYRSIICAAESEIKELADCFADEIRSFSPGYAEEIEALSSGAGLAPWQVYALNSRTELIRILNTRSQSPAECTTVFFRDAKFAGQTWDWAQALEGLTVIAQLDQPGKPRILQLTEPGIIGKIGINENGLAVCLNILRSSAGLGGVPVHVLLRAVLESANVQEAVSTINAARLGTMSHLLIVDAAGGFASLEISGEDLGRCGLSGNTYVHTNHYLALDIDNAGESFRSSHMRFRRAAELCAGGSCASLEEMQRILTDKANGGFAITHDYNADEVIGSEGTICAVIFDLAQRRMHITEGSPLRNPFRTYCIDPDGGSHRVYTSAGAISGSTNAP